MPDRHFDVMFYPFCFIGSVIICLCFLFVMITQCLFLLLFLLFPLPLPLFVCVCVTVVVESRFYRCLMPWIMISDHDLPKTIIGSTFRAATSYRVSCSKVSNHKFSRCALIIKDNLCTKIIFYLSFPCADVLLYWSRHWRRRWGHDQSLQRIRWAWTSAADQDPWCPCKIRERCLHQRQPRELSRQARSWLGSMHSSALFIYSEVIALYFPRLSPKSFCRRVLLCLLVCW